MAIMLKRSLWSKITQVHSFLCPRETCVDQRSWPRCHQVSNILSLSLSILKPIFITTYQHDVDFKCNPQCCRDGQRSLWLPVQRAACQQLPHCCWFSQVGLRLILTKFPSLFIFSLPRCSAPNKTADYQKIYSDWWEMTKSWRNQCLPKWNSNINAPPKSDPINWTNSRGKKQV